MKKIFFIALISTLSVSGFSQDTQDNGRFRGGIGAAYASEVDGSGISIKGIYGINEKWETAVTYSHFFENLGLMWNVVDIDAQFVFYDNNKKTKLYAISGIALTYWERETLGTIIIPSETKTGTYTGWNIGVGANFVVSERLNLTPELRGTIFDLSYTRIGLTLQYLF